jgi:hypothetical protein
MHAGSKLLAPSAVGLVALVAALVAGCSSETKAGRAAAKSDPPVLELTGRVGDMTLGESKAKVESDYGIEGEGFHVTFRNGGSTSGYYRLHHGRVVVSFDGGRVSALDVRTPYYRTNGGIGLGSRIPLGPCHKTATNPCEHRWHGFVWNAWVRETACNCWVKVGRGRQSLLATTKNFLKPWFFIDVRQGRVAHFYFAWRFVD